MFWITYKVKGLSVRITAQVILIFCKTTYIFINLRPVFLQFTMKLKKLTLASFFKNCYWRFSF